MLLPGAYNTSGFVQDLTKKKVTYGFLDTEREEGPKIGHGYGDKVWDWPTYIPQLVGVYIYRSWILILQGMMLLTTVNVYKRGVSSK